MDSKEELWVNDQQNVKKMPTKWLIGGVHENNEQKKNIISKYSLSYNYWFFPFQPFNFRVSYNKQLYISFIKIKFHLKEILDVNVYDR